MGCSKSQFDPRRAKAQDHIRMVVATTPARFASGLEGVGYSVAQSGPEQRRTPVRRYERRPSFSKDPSGDILNDFLGGVTGMFVLRGFALPLPCHEEVVQLRIELEMDRVPST
jgi:hypothetical protein